MKRMVLVVAVVLGVATVGWAHMMGGAVAGAPQTQEWIGGPGMMGGYGMMGPYGYGMMGGYGMGPGMMGSYGYGPGYGMGPGMMGGYGPGYGMVPGGANVYSPQMKKFLDETTDLRKEIHNKQFEYAEALRDPKTTPESIWLLEKELRDLTGKLTEKMYEYQRPR